MKKIELKNTTTYVLSFLVVVMIGFLLWVSNMFQKTEKRISNDLYKYQISEISYFMKNIERYIDIKYGKDLSEKLKKDIKARKELNLYLSSFITVKIKNIFIVYKPEKEQFFRVLADGSLNQKDKFAFNEKFEPLKSEYWYKVLATKEPVIFKQKINDIWTTYLYPVVKFNRVSYIIVVDFSTLPLNVINDNLQILKSNLKVILFVMIISVVILVFFLFYDWKRQKEMQNLIKELKILNDTLEDKVQEEIQKNREKEKQLILQSRMALMGELLSMIAHQWRQPLNVMSLIISQLKIDFDLGDINEKEIKKSIIKIEELIQHLSNTIDDFRKFYRREDSVQSVDLKNIIEQTLNIAKPSIENKNIKIIQDIKCKKKVKTFPNELKQVLLNIIRNAEDILKERKIQDPYIKIKVYYDYKKNLCIIDIEDNGGGIREDIIDKIFNPYFTTKDERNGTGLGLYMSKQIVEERLKGKLYAFNSEVGAVFRIELKVDHE
ncbi:multi-sensor signal transduction histidine kinase [Nautilia profundicola AmH]|uniref:histidine kinase n=1 Tax=Nautilia profundicola (strain ATCC BAA-1463 / DSM 18972 / AmH) TaxID=598659 RepID=B9L941_NAUPA|nr:HAMP domain-containing sensor histidine kinase [Nautilia profundicola]ACM92828.1 multi-sensor signal transduction histidine kinase [Nautilia profundicola AmH]